MTARREFLKLGLAASVEPTGPAPGSDRYGYAFEQATKHRRPPTLGHTVPLAERFW